MKITQQQLAPHLTKTLAPIYIVSGDETLLVEETLDTIRKSAQQKGYNERTRIAIDSADWSALLYAAAQHLSFFLKKKLLNLIFHPINLTKT